MPSADPQSIQLRLCRSTYRALAPAAALLIALAACGGDDGDGDGGGEPDATASTSDAGDTPGEWQTLIGGEWELGPGTEDYRCVRLTIAQDMHITEFRAIAPLGTHHSVLTVGNGGQPDGITSCNAGTNAPAMIYGAGINTNDIALPAGVAMPVRAGQQLLLNLHLFNASDAPLSGLSEVQVKTIPAQEVIHEAEVILMGKVLTLQIPPGESTQVGSCVQNGDVNLFMVNPHMHQLGTHMKVIAKRAGMPDTVIHDLPYDFEEQQIYPISEIAMQAGDVVEMQCSYNNTTGSTVTFGDSSTQEMCFATTYRYPAFGGTFGIVCASD